MKFKFGIDVLEETHFSQLRNKRIGLLTNPSGVNSQLQSTYEIMWNAEEVNLVVLFAPEHGFNASSPDGETIETMTDPKTGITIFSLYGQSYKPTPAMMQQIDTVVIDIQDIGVRYYTFVWSMSYMLEACAEHNIEVILLDRPNPLKMDILAPILDSSIETLVGRFSIPIIHNMTIGELANMINQTWLDTPANLSIIKCQNYEHNMSWDTINRHWVAPSPNIPHVTTITHYIGSCLIEGTNLSEGRGTPLPFEIIGSPWLDGHDLAKYINKTLLDQQQNNMVARPYTFIPTSSKYSNHICHGIQMHLMGNVENNLIHIWVGILDYIHQTYPKQFEWIKAEEGNTPYHIDRLIGIEDFHQATNLVEKLIQHCPVNELNKFQELRQQYLLYRD